MARSEHGGDKSEERESSEVSEDAVYEAMRSMHRRLARRGDEFVARETAALVTLAITRRDLEEALAESEQETFEPDPSEDVPAAKIVDRDNVYFDEVRRAVGSGTPTVLLGTSSRSLEANFQKVQAAQRATSRPDDPASTEPSTRWRRAVSLYLGAVLLGISLLGLSTVVLILSWDQRSSLANALTIALLITSWVVLTATAISSRRRRTEKIRVAELMLRAEARHPASQSEQSVEEKKG